MEKKFEINGIKFDVTAIKKVYLESAEYIFVPKYRKDNSLKNKVTHNVYQFLNMEPYGLFNSEIDLANIKYVVENLNGFIENEEPSVICKQTKEYKYIETAIVDCVVILSDKEYRFYGSGIDCANANMLYNKVNLLMKGMNNSNSAVSTVTDVLNKTSTSVGKLSKTIVKLPKEKKVLLAAVLFFIFLSIIISIGASKEKKENLTTTINQTIEPTSVYEYIDVDGVEDTTTSDYDGIEIDEFTTEVETSETTTKETTTKEPSTKETTTKQTSTKEVTTTTEEYVEEVVYITNTGSKYHNYGCRHLKSTIEITLSQAKAKGYTPCGTCN